MSRLKLQSVMSSDIFYYIFFLVVTSSRHAAELFTRKRVLLGRKASCLVVPPGGSAGPHLRPSQSFRLKCFWSVSLIIHSQASRPAGWRFFYFTPKSTAHPDGCNHKEVHNTTQHSTTLHNIPSILAVCSCVSMTPKL